MTHTIFRSKPAVLLMKKFLFLLCFGGILFTTQTAQAAVDIFLHLSNNVIEFRVDVGDDGAIVKFTGPFNITRDGDEKIVGADFTARPESTPDGITDADVRDALARLSASSFTITVKNTIFVCTAAPSSSAIRGSCKRE